jgi:hypothetical protein
VSYPAQPGKTTEGSGESGSSCLLLIKRISAAIAPGKRFADQTSITDEERRDLYSFYAFVPSWSAMVAARNTNPIGNSQDCEHRRGKGLILPILK